MKGNDMADEQNTPKKVKSVIIDSELKEWKEWGDKWFGRNCEWYTIEENNDDVYSNNDLKTPKK